MKNAICKLVNHRAVSREISADYPDGIYEIHAKVWFENTDRPSKVTLKYIRSQEIVFLGKNEITVHEDVLGALRGVELVFNDEIHLFESNAISSTINTDYYQAEIFRLSTDHGRYDVLLRYIYPDGECVEKIIYDRKFTDVLDTMKSQIVPAYVKTSIIDEEICKEVNSYLHFDIRKLIDVSKEFDHDYIVYVGHPMDERFCSLINWSGHSVSHKPYFSMEGYAHEMWVINPYQKVGHDSALRNAESISVEEFLTLFQ